MYKKRALNQPNISVSFRYASLKLQSISNISQRTTGKNKIELQGWQQKRTATFRDFTHFTANTWFFDYIFLYYKSSAVKNEVRICVTKIFWLDSSNLVLHYKQRYFFLAWNQVVTARNVFQWLPTTCILLTSETTILIAPSTAGVLWNLKLLSL